MLQLGETEDLSCTLQDDSKELQEVVVTGSAGVNATKTGAAQSISSKQIADMPSITHGIADVARLNPQLTTSNNGAMSFAGASNRYNSFMIDGAMNNDVFGLTADGSMVVKQERNLFQWRLLSKFRLTLLLLMYDRVVLRVVLLMLLLSLVLINSTVVCMVLEITKA